MLAVALRCAAAGWPVLPLTPGRKTPAGNCPDCQGRAHTPRACPCLTAGGWCHGFHAATTNTARLHEWWQRNPRFGVGVACGRARLLVLDIDTHPTPPPERNRLLPGIPIYPHIELAGLSSGFDTLALLAALRDAPDPAADSHTLRVRTPSGGLHVWYRTAAPYASSTGSNKRRALAWQVDVRAAGSYIIAPGTRTFDGAYTPLDGNVAPAPLPTWLAEELDRTAHRTPARPPATSPLPRGTRYLNRLWGSNAAARLLSPLLQDVADCATAPSGTGFADKLNRAAYTAGGLISAGALEEEQARTLLEDVAQRARPEQGTRAAGIIRSGLTAGLRRPLSPGARP